MREGIYNALVHNVYMTGTPIQIRIDEHSIEISNSCILPEDWTVDSLMESHKSEPYNPSIANVFYRMGYIENWGRGIEKIVAACERLGAPRPEYKVIGYGITLYLYALEAAVIRDAKGSELASNDTLGGGTDSEEFRRVPKSSEDSTFALTKSEESVYTYLLNRGPARTSEIANAVALTPRGTLKVLKRLEEKRLVHAEGSTSSRVYKAISM